MSEKPKTCTMLIDDKECGKPATVSKGNCHFCPDCALWGL